MIDALEAPRRELRPVVAVLDRQHRGAVLAVGQGPVHGAAAERRVHRRGRVVGGRLERLLDRREGQHRDEGRAYGASAILDSVVLDENLVPVEPGSGVVGKVARKGNIPLEYYKDPEKTAETFVTASRRHALLDARRLRDARGRRHDHAARARLGVDQLGRREDLPRGGGGRGASPPRGVRLRRGRRARRAVGRAGRGGDRSRGEGTSPTLESIQEQCRASTSPATRCRARSTSSTAIERSPSGKPDYPWAKRVALGEISASSTA